MVQNKSLILILNLLFSTSNITPMHQKADSQAIPAHEETVIKKQIKTSLREKFGELDVTYIISEYLTPQAPHILIKSPGFNNAPATKTEIESIKDFLRTLYWMNGNKKAEPQKASTKPSIDQIAAYNALKYATQNKYGQHTLEITALAVACGADMTRNLATGELHQPRSAVSILQQVGSMNGYKQHYEKLVHDAVQNDYVPMAKLSITAGFKDQLIKHVDSRPPAIKIINYLIDSNN